MDKSGKIFPTISMTYLSSNYITGNKESDEFYTDPKIRQLAENLANAFTKWGFVYIVDHGINPTIINDALNLSKEFFMMDKSVKDTYMSGLVEKALGYVPFNVETFDKSRPHDLKETFNFLPTTKQAERFNKTLPGFMKAQTTIFNSCTTLSLYILRLVNIVLSKDNFNYLASAHESIGDLSKNMTLTRLLHYPAVPDRHKVPKLQFRCGEHSDFGSLTFLFQDSVGGLQVKGPNGNFVDVVPVPGSIVVNVGDLLEIWSAGRFKSARHRAIIPSTNQNIPRQSIAIFTHPDKKTMVSCLDGSDKFLTVNAREYEMKKFAEAYNKKSVM